MRNEDYRYLSVHSIMGNHYHQRILDLIVFLMAELVSNVWDTSKTMAHRL